MPVPILELRLHCSRTLGLVLLVAHGGALVILVLLTLHTALKLLAAAIVLMAWWRAHTTHVVRTRASAITAARLGADGRWRLVRRDAGHLTDLFLADGFVHPLLTVLVLRTAGGTPAVLLIVPDMVDATAFRRLRSRLGSSAGSAPRQTGTSR